ncbi:hypothetical protein FACS1894133_2490 [Clostridia bacterium]|nr:hypothetical protein FACS1894133_2490 [Clostridia bacterium]
MAVVKSTENKIKHQSALVQALKYITNPEKVFAVSAENCNGYDFVSYALEFGETRIAKDNDGGILAHHYVQSFSPDDKVTPEQAHKIGLDFVKKIAPNYQVVLATHVDRDHTHNHFIINAVNPLTGYKWHDNKDTLNHMRDVSDELCRECGLSVIDENTKSGIDQTTYQLAVKGKSWKADLVKDLDEAVLQCRSKLDFVDCLNKRGYHVRYKNAHITITKRGEKKGIRVDTLAKQFGEKYAKTNLEKAMGYYDPRENVKAKVYAEKRNTPSASFVTEWQRYEHHTFSAERKSPKKFAGVTKLPKTKNLILKIILYVLLKIAKKFPKPRRQFKEKTYKYVPLKKPRVAPNDTRAIGNISKKELAAADGANFRAELDTLQLLKLSEADFFFCARVDVKKKTTYVTIKEYNKTRLAELIGVPVETLESKNAAVQNQIVYGELKKQAADENVKLSYKVVGEAELTKLQQSKIKFAYFKKDDGKVNVAYLPGDFGKVCKVLSVEVEAPKTETEFQKNTKVNNEIKNAAALAGEKPRYRVVDAEQLALMKASGVKFASFKNGEKFNTVFLRQDESKVKAALLGKTYVEAGATVK